jgi:hypothetical protein
MTVMDYRRARDRRAVRLDYLLQAEYELATWLFAPHRCDAGPSSRSAESTCPGVTVGAEWARVELPPTIEYVF